MLPFDVPGNEDWFELTEEIRVQRLESITISEAIALGKVLTPELLELLKDPLIQTEATLYFRAVLTTILLVSRYEAATTLEIVLDTLTIEQIVTASDFLLAEKDAIGKAKANDDEDGEGIDWEKAWFKLQRHYPFVPHFSREQFGNCPLRWVKKALSELQEEQLQQLCVEAAAISRLGYYMLQFQGEKKVQPDWFNPWQQVIQKQQAKAAIPQEAARVFLELCNEQNVVPPWAVLNIDIERIRWAAEDD